MNTKKLIICTLVVFVMSLLSDIIWYNLMADMLRTFIARDQPLMIWAILSVLIAAFMFCYLYGKISKGSNKTIQGIKHGLILSFTIYVPFSMNYYATSTIYPPSTWIINVSFHIVLFMIIGIVVAHISGIPASANSEVNG